MVDPNYVVVASVEKKLPAPKAINVFAEQAFCLFPIYALSELCVSALSFFMLRCSSGTALGYFENVHEAVLDHFRNLETPASFPAPPPPSR